MRVRCAALVCTLSAGAAFGQCDPIDVGPFVNTFSSPTLTRGMWFTAPTDFTICGLEVPNESGHPLQNVEVVRFTNGFGPTQWPTLTNDFVSLFRAIGQPSNTVIACDIPIITGDIIGILGACGDASTMRNSYGPPPGQYQSNIMGFPVTLQRCGMQFNLVTTPARDMWWEPPGSFTRVIMHVGSGVCYPDCDTSTGVGVLDIFDFLCFGNRFAAGDPYACDCDTTTGPLVCDIFDFLCFGNEFNAGCP